MTGMTNEHDKQLCPICGEVKWSNSSGHPS